MDGSEDGPANDPGAGEPDARRVPRRQVLRIGGAAVAGVAAIYVKPTLTRIQIPTALAASGGPPVTPPVAPPVSPPASPPASPSAPPPAPPPPAPSPVPPSTSTPSPRAHPPGIAPVVPTRLPRAGEPKVLLSAGLAAGLALVALGRRIRAKPEDSTDGET